MARMGTRAASQKFSVKVMERQVTISVEITENLFTDTIWPLESLRREIESEYLARVGIVTEVRFVEPKNGKDQSV